MLTGLKAPLERAATADPHLWPPWKEIPMRKAALMGLVTATGMIVCLAFPARSGGS
jgi:hypothetical protein